MLAEPDISPLLVHSFDGEKAFQGQGTAVFRSGHTYTGQFSTGALQGQGTYTWKDGVVYTGEFNDNKIQGSGTYTWYQ